MRKGFYSWYVMMIFFICTVNDDGIMVPSPVELFVVCVDILQTLCLAVLEGCPNELSHHLHTVVTSLVPFTKSSHTKHGQQVSIRKRKTFEVCIYWFHRYMPYWIGYDSRRKSGLKKTECLVSYSTDLIVYVSNSTGNCYSGLIA